MTSNWSENISIGDPRADREHSELLEHLRQIHQSHETGASGAKLTTLLSGLLSMTEQHFAHEADLMAEHGFPGREDHLKEHALLLRDGNALLDELRNDRISFSIDTLKFLERWLFQHMKRSDREVADWIRNATNEG